VKILTVKNAKIFETSANTIIPPGGTFEKGATDYDLLPFIMMIKGQNLTNVNINVIWQNKKKKKLV